MLGAYKNGNYNVIILEDGTKIRQTEANEFIPAFAENCDVKITDKCNVGCPFCYEGCTPGGKHAIFDESLNNFFNSLHPYTELALNGNDMDCPGLENFLTVLKTKKILPNITVHCKQLLDNIQKLKDWQDRKLIYGIGVSVDQEYLSRALTMILGRDLKNVVFHTIAGITTSVIYEYLADHQQKVLVLGYKDLGRGVNFKTTHNAEVEKNRQWLQDNIKNLWSRNAVLSFDNLALEQLDIRSLLTPEEWERFYMGDDGSFTFYIDLVKRTFSKNSLCHTRFPMENKTIDEMFQFIRDYYKKD
jgi:hypothetical protein